eukprot:COSAG05_NODE_14885_length_384_cov_0.898246_2_plen_23_part_01
MHTHLQQHHSVDSHLAEKFFLVG